MKPTAAEILKALNEYLTSRVELNSNTPAFSMEWIANISISERARLARVKVAESELRRMQELDGSAAGEPAFEWARRVTS
jgi:hypothetical protein